MPAQDLNNIIYLPLDETSEAAAITDILSGEYKIIARETPKDCLEEINTRTDISAVIIDTPSKQDNVLELISYIEQNNNDIFAIATLILTSGVTEKEDLEFLSLGVVDCISKPVQPVVLKNRLRVSIEYVNSVSFSEFAGMLRVLPANIYLKDSQGRYVFSSQIWHHLETGDDPNWTIRGKTDLDIRKDKGVNGVWRWSLPSD